MTFNPVLMQMQPRELSIPIETNRANINIESMVQGVYRTSGM